ncbi:MAG: C40 family peptidase [Gemmatimonadaceae bacterium]
MQLRVPVIAVLMFCLIAPATVEAQIPSTHIRLSDIERGISIGRTVVEIARRSRSTERSTGRRTKGSVPPASTGAGTSRGSTPGTRSSSRAAARTVRLVIDSGEEFIGVPYLWGGTSPTGFDCSGFVQYIFRKHGVELPRTSRQMAGAGIPVDPRVAALMAGDLMLFSGREGSVIKHVALYAGDNRILHSSSSGHGVRYDDLNSKRGHYFVAHLVAARRVTANGRSLADPLSWTNGASPFDYLDPPDAAPSAPREKF